MSAALLHERARLVIPAAIAGNADFLVTGGKNLQSLGRYQHVVILSLRQFLDVLRLDGNGQQ
jgi:predicted nucleic acid-binding protein